MACEGEGSIRRAKRVYRRGPTWCGYAMGSYVTVSAKVRRELREEAERLGVNISEVIRRALEEEVRRRKIELLRRKLEEVGDVLDEIDVARIVEAVREQREER